ncbi:hypothetical protein IAT38_000165 [Cryptococcus sp. DSM 104549]
MGCHGLFGFILRSGVHKGTWCHFDSYPEGLGRNIIDYILSLNEDDLNEMAFLIEAITWIYNDDEKPPLDAKARYMEYGLGEIEETRRYRGPQTWSQILSCNQGVKILKPIRERRLKHLIYHPDSIDHWNCEWYYFIDFWNRELEVFRGGSDERVVRSFDALKEDPRFLESMWPEED